MGLSGEALAAFVTRSCEAQGVPVRLADAGVVGRVVVLLGGDPPARAAKPSADGSPPSELPRDLDSVGVELSGARGPGPDHDVINDGGDDGGLAGEVEVGPSAA